MLEQKLNKISTRYYWQHFLAQKNISAALFFPSQLDHEEKVALFEKHVCIINIETSSYCNRKCSYCPVSLNDSRKKQTYMPYQIFNKLLSELKEIDYKSTVCLNLYNEPLADADIFQRVIGVRSALPNAFIMFNSNGDYITDKELNLLSDIGLNALFVTLHPPVNKSYKLNDRIKDFRKFLKKIKIDIATVKLSETSENNSFECNVEWTGKMRLRIMANDWLEYGNSRAGAIEFLDAKTPRIMPCVRPLREFTVSYDGSVFPCCQFFPDDVKNKNYKISNITKDSIFEIYASDALASWRKELFTFGEKQEPCDTCKDEDFSPTDSSQKRVEIITLLRNSESSK